MSIRTWKCILDVLVLIFITILALKILHPYVCLELSFLNLIKYSRSLCPINQSSWYLQSTKSQSCSSELKKYWISSVILSPNTVRQGGMKFTSKFLMDINGFLPWDTVPPWFLIYPRLIHTIRIMPTIWIFQCYKFALPVYPVNGRKKHDAV